MQDFFSGIPFGILIMWTLYCVFCDIVGIESQISPSLSERLLVILIVLVINLAIEKAIKKGCKGKKEWENGGSKSMNRKQRRNLLKEKSPQKPKHNTASISATNAQSIVDNLPIAQIVSGINNLLSQLESRKVHIHDWDDKARLLYRLQMQRGKIYFLAETEAELESDNINREMN